MNLLALLGIELVTRTMSSVMRLTPLLEGVRLNWYTASIGTILLYSSKNRRKFDESEKMIIIHINLHHLAMWYVKNIFQSIFSSSVLKGKVTFIIKQILRFSKIWITSCIWRVINSLKLNKENIKKWINGLSDITFFYLGN